MKILIKGSTKNMVARSLMKSTSSTLSSISINHILTANRGCWSSQSSPYIPEELKSYTKIVSAVEKFPPPHIRFGRPQNISNLRRGSFLRMQTRRMKYSQLRAIIPLVSSSIRSPLLSSASSPLLLNSASFNKCDTRSIFKRNYATQHDNHLDNLQPKSPNQKRESSSFKDSIFFKSGEHSKQQQQQSLINNNESTTAAPKDDVPTGISDVNKEVVITQDITIKGENDFVSLLSTTNQLPDDDGTGETAEDLIFDMFHDGNNNIKLSEFLSSLSAAGLHYNTDPRLKEFKKNLKALKRDDGPMCKNDFKAAIKPNIVLISRAMKGDFVIPDWTRFTKTLEEFYWRCRVNKNGQVANYIPQLAKYNPDYWGVSLCSIDGQRYHVGDVDVPFTIQSSGKPINYAIALNELGSDITHKYVGQEPSGRLFNDLSLKIFDDSGHPKPHNPMVNSGAIVICSLLMDLIKKDMRSSEKFDWVCDFYKSMAGGEYIGFNNATFLSEREAADRNYAIGFYMRENRCFPEKTNLQQVMDFYFQLCSLEVNCKTVSMIAATLANGGICPITEKKVIDSRAVRNVLSLMHSCGMYDYSGQFAFYVGLPAKSGVSGCTLVVIPNVGGLGLFSPPLDTYGNSVRSLQFCHELVNQFNFHQYDNLRHVPHKSDPRRKKYETAGLNIICLLFAAAKGDMSAIRRYYMSEMDMSISDYDHRTALHAAAAEGNLEIVEFLLKVANVDHEPRDRWGRRPIDDATFCGHTHVVNFLKAWPEINGKNH